MAAIAGALGVAEDISLVYTPTWIVAAVCAVIVILSLAFAHSLHFLGRQLKKQKRLAPLAEALQKVKEELMLLGFISLLLTVFQGPIQGICISDKYYHSWLPCIPPPGVNRAPAARAGVWSKIRQLMAVSSEGTDKCQKQGKVPLLSLEAIHQLHIFIFVLAMTHVVLSLITVVLGMVQMRRWGTWEINNQIEETIEPAGGGNSLQFVSNIPFIRDHYTGFGEAFGLSTWMGCFFKQFYEPINRSDYVTMRRGFIAKQCPGNPDFDFYSYIVRSIQDDFQIVVEISWYLWAFALVFITLNVAGFHAYFWLGLLPLVILLVVGAKLEHIITELAHNFAEKHIVTTETEVVVKPSDDYFWFRSPKAILVIIHMILFENAFELAIFFWILTTYGFNSCIMDKKEYVICRLIFSVIIEVVCAYSTLPLYAIVSNMGSSFKKAIFEGHVTEGLLHLAKDAKKKRRGEGTSSYAGIEGEEP